MTISRSARGATMVELLVILAGVLASGVVAIALLGRAMNRGALVEALCIASLKSCGDATARQTRARLGWEGPREDRSLRGRREGALDRLGIEIGIASGFRSGSLPTARLAREVLVDFLTRNERSGIRRYLFKLRVLVSNVSQSGDRSGPVEVDAFILGKPPATQLERDELVLAFLHEQAHNAPVAQTSNWRSAVGELKRMYPGLAKAMAAWNPRMVKDMTPEQLDWFVYQHVMVNWMELQAGKRFLGQERAYAVVATTMKYGPIYDLVLDHEDEIAGFMTKFKFNVDPYERRTVKLPAPRNDRAYRAR